MAELPLVAELLIRGAGVAMLAGGYHQWRDGQRWLAIPLVLVGTLITGGLATPGEPYAAQLASLYAAMCGAVLAERLYTKTGFSGLTVFLVAVTLAWLAAAVALFF